MIRPNASSRTYEAFRELWEKRQRDLEEIYGDEGRAKVVSLMLEELEAARLDELMEEGTLKEVVESTGFSEDTIRRKLDAGEVRNVGSPGSISVRMIELPFRAGRAHPSALRRRLYGELSPPTNAAPSATLARLEPVQD